MSTRKIRELKEFVKALFCSLSFRFYASLINHGVLLKYVVLNKAVLINQYSLID